MNPYNYQELASRTIAPQEKALERIVAGGAPVVQLLHSVIGMMGELGEICSLIQKVYWYGKEIDQTELNKQLNLEFGDALWYHSEGLTALKMDLMKIMQDNIEKLKKRYPEKYSDEKAWEENRDRKKEESHVSSSTKVESHVDNQNPNDGPGPQGVGHSY